MLRELIFLSGIYGLACASSHLLGFKNILSRMHGDILLPDAVDEDTQKNMQRRLLSYWIFTYGIVRLAAVAPLFSEAASSWECMVATNYLIESFAYALEGFVYKTVDRQRAACVAVTSAFLGFAALCLVFCTND